MTVLILVAIVALGLAAFGVWAQGAVTTTRGGPFDFALLGTYAWVTVIAALGGLASFHRRVRDGESRWINITELVGELVTSAAAGLFTYFLCRWAGVNEWLMAAFVGVSGHMGSRALFMLEKFLSQKFGKTVNTIQ